MSNREELAKLLKERYKLSDIQTDNVLEYAYSLSQSVNKPNDFALAYLLNNIAINLFEMVANNNNTPDISSINRSYILITNELKKIYSRNPELEDIKDNICWKSFDRLEYIHNELGLYSYHNEGDYGYGHNAQVNRLCIINNKEKASLTSKLKKIVNSAKLSAEAFRHKLEEASEVSEVDDGRYISNYALTYDNNGAIWVNSVLMLNKNHIGRTPDLLMSQAFKHDGDSEPFKPSFTTSRQITTILGDMGFDETLRALFFPVINKTNGIIFRSKVGRIKANLEKIDTRHLDAKLKKLGAATERHPDSPIDLSEIPF